MAKQCELIIGYLLPRRCEEKAITTCSKCGRAVCDLHARMGDEGILCRDCYEHVPPRSLKDKPRLPESVRKVIYRREDFDVFEAEREEEAFVSLS